jgi:SAM-dependent methyltransferase
MDQSVTKSVWNARYNNRDFLFGTHPNEFLKANLDRLANGNTLCLAEGEGRNAVFLAEQGHTVSSVDLSEVGVEKTLRLASEKSVHVTALVGDLAVFDLGEARWDSIVSIFAHTPPAVRKDLHRRVVSALKPGGVFLLEAYTPDQIGRGTGGPPVAELTMTLAELEQELAGLSVEYGSEHKRSVIEGPGHTGVGAVVQFVAAKPH